jgi:hypothetical protein
VEAGFNSDIGGDVPDWDSTESRESDEDAAWRDLVARFDAPATTTEPAPWPEREDVPPIPTRESRGANAVGEADGNQHATGAEDEREADGVRGAEDASGAGWTESNHGAHAAGDLPGTNETGGTGGARARREPEGRADGAEDSLRRGTQDPLGRGTGDTRGRGTADGPERGTGDPLGHGTEDELGRGTGDARGRGGEAVSRGTAGMRGFDDEGIRGALDPDGLQGVRQPDVIPAARHRRRTAERKIRGRQTPVRATRADDEDEHFVPPAPPPLPKLDSMAKGAWAALFGGPGYLVVATAAGWSVPGFAAFCAVAAFIAGFAILVLRINEPDPGGPDDGDDGAVV